MKGIILLLFSALSFTINAAAQHKVSVVINWQPYADVQQFADGKYVSTYTFKGALHLPDNGYWPAYTTQVPMQTNGQPQVTVEDVVYAPVAQLYTNQPKLTSDFQVKTKVSYQRKQPMVQVQLVPLRINAETGEWEKLVSCNLVVTYSGANAYKKALSGTYAAASVLSSGNWFKMGVSQTGIHKIDYTTLTELGINPDNIDPRTLRIHGNGGGILPENNAAPRHDDLVENPIVVVGEADGVFNTGDFILFYAEGPSLWHYIDSQDRFTYNINPYDTKNYYFITVGGQNGKRVTTQASAGSATQTTTTFDSYAEHEVDEVNLIRSGSQWFGDYYNFSTTTRSFSLSLPTLAANEPVTISTEVAARSTIAPSAFPVKVNGQLVYTTTVDKVGDNYTTIYANTKFNQTDFNSTTGQFNVQIDFQNASSSAEGWLNFIQLQGRSALSFSGSALSFRDSRTVGAGNVTEFSIAGSANRIWDVTDPTHAKAQQYTSAGGRMKFTIATDVLKEFVAFNDNGSFPKPEAAGAVANQNLHGIGQPDYLIVTTAELKTEAERLAQHHRVANNLSVQVVDIDQIYNEFSSGRLDVSAIRNFVKMVYDRAGNNVADLPQYLLLFGDGSYDFRNLMGANQGHVPTYQSDESLNPITSFCTDDYFGFLDDGEGGSIQKDVDLMDIAIGRFPVRNAVEAAVVADKVIHYESTETFGSWRNNITFVGDDEDGNLHINDADDLSNQLSNLDPVYNIDKIYFDAYKQQSTPAKNRYSRQTNVSGRALR